MAPKKTEQELTQVLVLCRRCTRYETFQTTKAFADAGDVSQIRGQCGCYTPWALGTMIRDPSGFEARAVIAERQRQDLERKLEVANAKLEAYDKVLGRLSDMRMPPGMPLWAYMR